ATVVIRRINTMQDRRPWIAWWDLEERRYGRQIGRLEPARETAVYEQQPMYAGVAAGGGEPRYAAAEAYNEPSYAEPSYGGPSYGEPAYPEPVYDEPEPAYAAASSLQAVPDTKPSRGSSEPVIRYDDPAPTLVGLPPLPRIPATPEPEPDPPAWTPFPRVVQERP